jgi:hypothetical protein
MRGKKEREVGELLVSFHKYLRHTYESACHTHKYMARKPKHTYLLAGNKPNRSSRMTASPPGIHKPTAARSHGQSYTTPSNSLRTNASNETVETAAVAICSSEQHSSTHTYTRHTHNLQRSGLSQWIQPCNCTART